MRIGELPSSLLHLRTGGAWLQSFWTVGTMAEAALASQILIPWGWRWLLGVSALPFGEFARQGRHHCVVQVGDSTESQSSDVCLRRKSLESSRALSITSDAQSCQSSFSLHAASQHRQCMVSVRHPTPDAVLALLGSVTSARVKLSKAVL